MNPVLWAFVAVYALIFAVFVAVTVVIVVRALRRRGREHDTAEVRVGYHKANVEGGKRL